MLRAVVALIGRAGDRRERGVALHRRHHRGRRHLCSHDPNDVATHVPLVGTVIIDVPEAATGLCGEAFFPGPANPLSTCVAVSGGNAVRGK